MESYELQALFDSRKSFYGKAKVQIENGKKFLLSYNTTVADFSAGRLTIYGKYSQTTRRHIVEFARQCGINCKSFSDLYGKI